MNDQLWAPWRLTYIMGDKKTESKKPLDLLPGADPGCFLCQYAADDDDCENLVVKRTDATITILNRFPYNNGHLLISPLRHIERLADLEDSVLCEISRTISLMVELLEDVLNPGGFNIGLNLGSAAGAGVPGHLHWHIVPRWDGDTNFMPVVGAVNVIPQSLTSLRHLLVGRLADLPDRE